eukprot:TRINITY_DN45725_c0_g1_i1.p1 TRINITY_DN45725_c0_g1~~TRINITY_DN45725_c0_g1_i1.p1  ORF type:complete len:360 (-),score=47.51 TRINITY_DN45725_c0_g1_i1:98-1111(-)
MAGAEVTKRTPSTSNGSGTASVKKTNSPPAATSGDFFTFILFFFWCVTSMLAITTSKVTMQALKVPLVLCSAQFLVATIVSNCVLTVTGMPKGMSRTEGTVLAGTSLTYTLGFFLTNLAFSLANASFVETVKSGEPVSTVILAFILLGEVEEIGTYASLLPVVVGVAMASAGEAGGTFAAFATTVGSNFAFSARAVYAKQLKRDHSKCPAATSDVCLFFHISCTGLMVLLPLAVIQEGSALQTALASSSFDAARFFSVMALNGLMYTAYNQLSFMVLSRVTTATHAVLNVCRRVCVIGVTTLFFGTPLSVVNIAGILIAVAGMLWFTRSKANTKKQK